MLESFSGFQRPVLLRRSVPDGHIFLPMGIGTGLQGIAHQLNFGIVGNAIQLAAQETETAIHQPGIDHIGFAISADLAGLALRPRLRSEEHTSELQSLMRISYAVFCLKKKKKTYPKQN